MNDTDELRTHMQKLKLLCEKPRSWEYSTCSSPLTSYNTHIMDEVLLDENEFTKRVVEQGDKITEQVKLLDVGPYNAVYRAVTTEKHRRGEVVIVMTVIFYHLHNLDQFPTLLGSTVDTQ